MSGSWNSANDVVPSSGSSADQCASRSMTVGRVRAVEPRRAAVEPRLVDQVELDRRDDAEHPLAAAQGEEELRVLGRRDPPQHAVAGDDLDGAHLVDGEAVGAGHRPEPAAGGVADDPDVGDRARERRQTVRRGGLHDRQPLHAGSGAGPALLGVDDHLVELLGGDEQLGGQLGHRAVAGGLRGDAHAVAGRELHGLDDVLGVEGGEDGGRLDRGLPAKLRRPGPAGRRPRRRDRAGTSSRRCGSPADHGLVVTPQATGHGAISAFVGELLVNTRGLDECVVHPEGWARVGAGVKWLRVVRGRRAVRAGAAVRARSPTSASSATPPAAAWARWPAPTGWPPTGSGRSRSSPATASCAGRRRPSTPTCSSGCAAARARWASSPRSSSTWCTSRSFYGGALWFDGEHAAAVIERVAGLDRRPAGGGDHLVRAVPAAGDARRAAACWPAG